MNERQIAPERIAHYTCRRIDEGERGEIDGNLDKAMWKTADKSRCFVDVVSGEPAFMDTRIASRWDDHNLYIAFWITEPSVQAAQTLRDSFVWYDNDVEVFFDGEDCYYEFQINALNTIYEAFFVYQDALKRGSRFDRPEFDLYTRNVDVLSGFQDPARYGKHPRGKRWAFMDYDFPGLRSAVQVDGTINDPMRLDRGWSVEAAFPWEGFATLYPKRTFPPKAGDTVRAAFFRFENLRYNGAHGSIAWALNEHGVYDCHIPENFSCIHFSD
jgi:hypothetical protein